MTVTALTDKELQAELARREIQREADRKARNKQKKVARKARVRAATKDLKNAGYTVVEKDKKDKSDKEAKASKGASVLPDIDPNAKPKGAPGVPRDSDPDMEGMERGQAWESHKAPNGGIYITSGDKTIVVGELRWHIHHTDVLKELIPKKGLGRLRGFQLGGKSSASSTD